METTLLLLSLWALLWHRAGQMQGLPNPLLSGTETVPWHFFTSKKLLEQTEVHPGCLLLHGSPERTGRRSDVPTILLTASKILTDSLAKWKLVTSKQINEAQRSVRIEKNQRAFENQNIIPIDNTHCAWDLLAQFSSPALLVPKQLFAIEYLALSLRPSTNRTHHRLTWVAQPVLKIKMFK